MASWSAPRTWVAGETHSAAHHNSNVRDNTLCVARVLAEANTDVTVTNTSIETNVINYTVPANTLGSNGRLRLSVLGDVNNTSGATRAYRKRVYFGGTVIYGWQDNMSDAANVISGPDVIIVNRNATNSQAFQVVWNQVPVASAGNALAGAPTHQYNSASWGTLTKDTTTGLAFVMSIEFDAGSSNLTYISHSWHLELLPSPTS